MFMCNGIIPKDVTKNTFSYETIPRLSDSRIVSVTKTGVVYLWLGLSLHAINEPFCILVVVHRVFP